MVIHGKKSLTLRKFQEDTLEYFLDPKSNPFLFLSAPTGSGKTFSLIVPFIASQLGPTYYEGAVGVYPTKALVNDQKLSLYNTLETLSKNTKTIEPGIDIFEVDFTLTYKGTQKRIGGKIGLVTLTRERLEELLEKLQVGSKRTLLEIMKETLIYESVDYLILLTVPEYPYMVLSHIYRSYPETAKLLQLISVNGYVYGIMKQLVEETMPDKIYSTGVKLLRQLRRIGITRTDLRKMNDIITAMFSDVLFMDEFHVWGLYEKPTSVALILTYYLIGLLYGRHTRIVLSSATPDPEIISLLKKVFLTDIVETIITTPSECTNTHTEKIRGKTHLVFEFVPTNIAGPVGWLIADSFLPEVIKQYIGELKQTTRFIVLGRRVSTLEHAAGQFYEKTGRMPILVTGVIHPKYLGREELARRAKQASKNVDLPLFGNYSVELGIDLENVNYAIITASSLEELVQRMGRVGRHGADSKVVIVTPRYVKINFIEKIGEQQIVSFKKLVNKVLPSALPQTHVLKRISVLETMIGKTRIYMPLALLALSSTAAYYDKINAPVMNAVRRTFVKIVEQLEIHKSFSWMSRKVSKSPEVLISLAAFRMAPTMKYKRGEKIDTASISTILSNYTVKLERDTAILLYPVRLPVSKVFKITLKTNPTVPPRNRINNTIMPSRHVLKLLNPEKSILTQLLVTSNRPVLTVITGVKRKKTLYELLNIYGYAVKMEFAGETVGYLVLL